MQYVEIGLMTADLLSEPKSVNEYRQREQAQVKSRAKTKEIMMKRVFRPSQVGVTVVVFVVVLSTLGVEVARAEAPTWLCVPKTAGKAVTSGGTGTEGKCEAENTTIELPPAAELPTLVSILSHAKYVASGIDSKPTIKFEGVNVQILNGEGKTNTVNGEGNLVVGYDENSGKHSQTGSHDLILGEEQTFTSYGSILAGYFNSATAALASVTGGEKNLASGERSSITGGQSNEATAELSSVTGGWSNRAGKTYAFVGGGGGNQATGEYSAISGGGGNLANGYYSSISGGNGDTASGADSSVSGGYMNTAYGLLSWVAGGYGNESLEYASVGGGSENKAEGKLSSVFGGNLLTATKAYEALL